MENPGERLNALERTELPRLSLEERDRRWEAIREEMKAADIDCLLIHGNSGKWDQQSSSMRYVGQIGGNGEEGWLVFPLEGEPTGFVFAGGAMLGLWNEVQDWVTDIRNTPGLRWSHSLIEHLEGLGLDDARIGVVGLEGYQETEGTVPYLTMTRLEDGLPSAEFVDATRLVEDLRLYKSEEEIEFIEKATEIGDYAITVMRQECQPGVPEQVAFAKAYEALLEAGSEQPVMFFWDSGKSVNHGQRFMGRRVLEKGDIIVNEISPRYFGYWAHFQAPVAVGEAPPHYQKLFDLAHESYKNALDTLRPGLKLRDVAEAFEEPIVEAGATSMHVYAHGTGGRGSEFPIIFPPLRREGMPKESLEKFDRVMNIDVKPGMVLAFEPHVTFDKERGLHLGDPVVVTETGCRRLSNLSLTDWISEPE